MKSDDEMRRAVVDAYYRRVLDQPEAARRRAQAAYVIASAVAAAVLAAGALGKLDREPALLQILGPIVLVAWLSSAGLFLWAVAVPYRDPDLPEEVKGFNAFLDAVLTSSDNERKDIDSRQRRARITAGVAAALTVLTVVLALALPVTTKTQAGVLRLRNEARGDLIKLCGKKMPSVVEGEIDTSSLADRSVAVELPTTACRDTEVKAVFDEEDVTYILK